jgi:hypothetical protein
MVKVKVGVRYSFFRMVKLRVRYSFLEWLRLGLGLGKGFLEWLG